MSSLLGSVIKKIHEDTMKENLKNQNSPTTGSRSNSGELINGSLFKSQKEYQDYVSAYQRGEELRSDSYKLAYIRMDRNDLKELLELKRRAEDIFGRTGNWDPSLRAQGDRIRERNGITVDVSFTDLLLLSNYLEIGNDFNNKDEHKGQHQNGSSQPLNSPNTLDMISYQNLKLNGTVNYIKVRKDGKFYDNLFGHIDRNGVTYIENHDGTGIRLIGNSGTYFTYSQIEQNGLKGGWNKEFKNRYETEIILKSDRQPPPIEYPPEPPQPEEKPTIRPTPTPPEILPPELDNYIREPNKPIYNELLSRPNAPIAKELLEAISKPEIASYLGLPSRPTLQNLVELPKEPVLQRIRQEPTKPPMQPYLDYPTRPTPPSPPNYLSFDEPAPSFEHNATVSERYKYYFGIDKVELGYIEKNTNSCFVSDYLLIEDKTNYIELDADYVNSSGSVEFSIIDNEEEVYIIPSKDTRIVNEKFFGETRFEIDKSEPIELRVDGKTVNTPLDSVDYHNKNVTVSYLPKDIDSLKKYRPKGNKIQVKTIIRSPIKELDAPYINNMDIRRYGGDMLWQNDTLSLW